MSLSKSFKHKFSDIGNILFRNIFLLVNGIIFVVVLFLFIFGDVREGIFLGLITILNIIIGATQEINAWWNLEKLQSLVIPKVILINENGGENIVLAEEVQKGDHVKLKMGDQVPCDGHLVSSHGFEVNEALITGESISFLRVPGGKLLAGGIVTSGLGIMEADESPNESRIAKMTKSIKKYTLNFSPIQKSLNKIIEYISYLLLFIIVFVVVRGLFVHELPIDIIKNIGALTSLLLPQGIVVIMTLIFIYGASNLYKKNVLIQEINATEKMGRIENLCIDKTGTLTENILTVKDMYSADGISKFEAEQKAKAYVEGSNDSSQTMFAIKAFLKNTLEGKILDNLSFSSSRQFGAISFLNGTEKSIILSGAPDILLPYLLSLGEKEWLQKIVDKETKIGNRLIFFAQAEGSILPKELSDIRLKAIAIFILDNNLREGINTTIDFFQTRGTVVRVISGDNLDTTRVIATLAGVKNTELFITGGELEKWSSNDYLEKTKNYVVFAQVKPEQKEKIILALKHSGFTAMIGDGANDALAIKKADLGIAMFDGAIATRQIASIVLVKNSFIDLPTGVILADKIIENIEICASIFFNQVFLGFLFFLIISILQFSFPFTPLNITFINYFAIGLPTSLVFFWLLKPSGYDFMPNKKSFLKRVLPFPIISAIPQSIVIIFVFYMSLRKTNVYNPTSLIILAFIFLGLIFFMFTPKVYTGMTTKNQYKQFTLLTIFEIVSIYFLIKIPIVLRFYNFTNPGIFSVLEFIPLLLLYFLVQYLITKWFFYKKIYGRMITCEKYLLYYQ